VVGGVVASRLGARGGLLERFAGGAQVARRPLLLGASLATSLAAWLTDAVEVALVLAAVGAHLPFAAALLVLLTLNLAITLPSTPAQIGAFEMGAIVALELLGVERERALAFALLYHVMQVVPVTLAGLGGLRLAWRLRGETALASSTENRPETRAS